MTENLLSRFRALYLYISALDAELHTQENTSKWERMDIATKLLQMELRRLESEKQTPAPVSFSGEPLKSFLELPRGFYVLTAEVKAGRDRLVYKMFYGPCLTLEIANNYAKDLWAKVNFDIYVTVLEL